MDRNKSKRKRSKSVAILLAILFGPWTWFYTYHRDAWKFWLGVSLNFIILLTVILILPNPRYGWSSVSFLVFHEMFSTLISLSWAVIVDNEIPNLVYELLNLGYIVIAWAPVWLWAIVDSVTKSKVRYESEPQVRNKNIALLLAVLFNYNTWLYTYYHRDMWKFWTCFGIVTIIAPIWFFLVRLFAQGHGAIYLLVRFPFVIPPFVLGGIWLWATIDTLLKSKEWYR